MGSLEGTLRIIERFFLMFFAGNKFNDIKSMCFVDYANYLHDRKNIEKAMLYYNKAITLNPDNYYAYGGLAAAQTEKGSLKQALESCNKAILIKPNVLLFILQSIIYKYLGEPLLVEVAKQKATELFEDKLTAYSKVADAYLKFSMYEDAEYYCKEAIKMNQNDAGLHNNLAEIFLAQQKFTEARDEFEKALELTSDKRHKKYAIENIKKIDSVFLHMARKKYH